MLLYVEIGLAALGLSSLGLTTWQMVATRRAIVAIEGRLARQADALTLLTETSEGGFAAIAQEMARREIVTEKPQREPSTRRMTAAVRRGKNVKEIAAAEKVSQGEVHLRLALAKHAADRGASKR